MCEYRPCVSVSECRALRLPTGVCAAASSLSAFVDSSIIFAWNSFHFSRCCCCCCFCADDGRRCVRLSRWRLAEVCARNGDVNCVRAVSVSVVRCFAKAKRESFLVFPQQLRFLRVRSGHRPPAVNCQSDLPLPTAICMRITYAVACGKKSSRWRGIKDLVVLYAPETGERMSFA